ncbi:MAG: anthranilate phosphoribosyltransferase, partial [Acidobacteria bacterium]
ANHGESLGRGEAREVMAEVLTPQCTDAQIAALLVALRMKGETVEEIVGFAEAIRTAAAPLPVERATDALAVTGTGRDALDEASPAEDSLVDTSGTGGDASGTFNISTATAMVTAGAGVRVAKHGNRSISSKCGSADVVEALGVNIQLSPERAAECLRKVGICFLYAPNLHPAMKQLQAVRRELRMRTMFNLLGPLTNPARASGQVVGVYSLDLVEKLAEALSMLGLRRALVVHGLDGLDEITITGATRIAEALEGTVRSYEVEPEEFGMRRATLQDITGGDATENAAIIRALNAGAALVAAGRGNHIAETIPLAIQSIDSGAASEKLTALARFTSAK